MRGRPRAVVNWPRKANNEEIPFQKEFETCYQTEVLFNTVEAAKTAGEAVTRRGCLENKPKYYIHVKPKWFSKPILEVRVLDTKIVPEIIITKVSLCFKHRGVQFIKNEYVVPEEKFFMQNPINLGKVEEGDLLVIEFKKEIEKQNSNLDSENPVVIDLVDSILEENNITRYSKLLDKVDKLTTKCRANGIQVDDR
jgi:hypothetical protein